MAAWRLQYFSSRVEKYSKRNFISPRGHVISSIYFMPMLYLQLYSFDDIANIVELPGGFIVGAGAGSSKFVGVNCEVNSVY